MIPDLVALIGFFLSLWREHAEMQLSGILVRDSLESILIHKPSTSVGTENNHALTCSFSQLETTQQHTAHHPPLKALYT